MSDALPLPDASGSSENEPIAEALSGDGESLIKVRATDGVQATTETHVEKPDCVTDAETTPTLAAEFNTDNVVSPRAQDFFVSADAEELVGCEHEDAEYDLDWEEDELTLPDLSLRMDMSQPMGAEHPLPKGRFADREISWMAFNPS